MHGFRRASHLGLPLDRRIPRRKLRPAVGFSSRSISHRLIDTRRITRLTRLKLLRSRLAIAIILPSVWPVLVILVAIGTLRPLRSVRPILTIVIAVPASVVLGLALLAAAILTAAILAVTLLTAPILTWRSIASVSRALAVVRLAITLIRLPLLIGGWSGLGCDEDRRTFGRRSEPIRHGADVIVVRFVAFDIFRLPRETHLGLLGAGD